MLRKYDTFIGRVKYLMPYKTMMRMNRHHIRVYGMIGRTYTPEERLKNFQDAMERIKELAPKIDYKEYDYDYDYEEEDDEYDNMYYEGFNYLSDEDLQEDCDDSDTSEMEANINELQEKINDMKIMMEELKKSNKENCDD